MISLQYLVVCVVHLSGVFENVKALLCGHIIMAARFPPLSFLPPASVFDYYFSTGGVVGGCTNWIKQ